MADKTLLGLNEMLFEQLNRLNNKDLKGEELDEEIKRSSEMNKVAKNIINNADLLLRAQIAKDDKLGSYNDLPELLEGERDAKNRTK